jgi:hypothetical protein
LALRADHAYTSGDSKKEKSLKKEIEGGIKCSGISRKFSTVTIFKGH